MLLPPTPAHEEARLAAVQEYDPFGPFESQPYDSILALARDLFEVSSAFVSLVDREEQVFPIRQGLDLSCTSRDVSFCAHAIAQEEMLVVLDASLDLRFADNPLVIGPPFIRFYAGAPLVSPSGLIVGTFCLADGRPRNCFSEASRRHMCRLADLVLDKLEMRRIQVVGQTSQVRFEQIAGTSPDGIICADEEGHITFWNAAAERMLGHQASYAVGRDLDLILPSRMRTGHEGFLNRIAGGVIPRLVGHLVELTALRASGTEFPVELSLSKWHGPTGTSYGVILRDITERRAHEQQMFRLAHHDPLTELPNRAVLRRRVEQLADSGESAALLLVDLDGFKSINDDLGHAAGDFVLKQVAQRLLDCVRNTDTVARLGGDEFSILLRGLGDANRAKHVAASIILAVSKPIVVEGECVSVGASIGIALYPQDGENKDKLLSSADLALHQAKSDGRHCHRLFSSTLRQSLDRRRAYDNELRRAYEGHEFELFYQPQVRAGDGQLVGAEALLRWRHPVDGLLSPAAFLLGLENRPISVEVGEWVLQSACRQAAVWRRAGAPQFQIGVNLFGSQFRSGDLVETTRNALLRADLPPTALELEITENIILRHDETMLKPLRQLRHDGVQIAFDDYGTGYASLSLLKRFPLTRLKIDKSFVQLMCESPGDAAIVGAVLTLGHAFGLSVIAEGVETEQQADLLSRDGCEELQGYLFGRPMPAAEFAERFKLGFTKLPVFE